MKLVYESNYQTAVHRRRIEALMDENASLKRRVSGLETTIKKHNDLKKEAAFYRKEWKRAREKYEETYYDCQEHENKCDRLSRKIADLERKLHRHEESTPVRSFSMSTAASRARESQVYSPRAESDNESCSGELTPAPTSRSDDDGQTSTPPSSAPDAPLPSYMRSTAASRAKAALPSSAEPQLGRAQEQSVGVEEEVDRGWGYESDEGRQSALSADSEPEECDGSSSLSDAEWYLLLEGRLGDKFTLTEWVDKSWLEGPAAGVKLRSRFVKELQAEALDLGAETWHAWGLVHTPDFMAEHAPEGPWDLLLDRSTLIRRGAGMYASGHLSGDYLGGGRHASPHRVTHLLFNCLGGGLRNRTYHFDRAQTWPREVHRLVYPVLELARELGDGARARRAEGLLARLRREAEATYDEVGRRLLLSALPGARPWAHHHEALFDAVLAGLAEHVRGALGFPPSSSSFSSFSFRGPGAWGRPRYGPAVLQAALEYQRHGRTAGMGRDLGLDCPEGEEDGEPADRALGYRYAGSTAWNADGEWWDEINGRCRWRKVTPRRRPSVHGADIEGMDRADVVCDGRWKSRRDPRLTLNWLDIALDF